MWQFKGWLSVIDGKVINYPSITMESDKEFAIFALKHHPNATSISLRCDWFGDEKTYCSGDGSTTYWEKRDGKWFYVWHNSLDHYYGIEPETNPAPFLDEILTNKIQKC